jgi:hypothetical protein
MWDAISVRDTAGKDSRAKTTRVCPNYASGLHIFPFVITATQGNVAFFPHQTLNGDDAARHWGTHRSKQV